MNKPVYFIVAIVYKKEASVFGNDPLEDCILYSALSNSPKVAATNIWNKLAPNCVVKKGALKIRVREAKGECLADHSFMYYPAELE